MLSLWQQDLLARMEWEVRLQAEVFGIVSPVKEYKLALRINCIGEWELAKQEDIIRQPRKKSPLAFSNFLFTTDMLSLRLICNQALLQESKRKNWLLKELKAYDYLLLIEDFSEQMDMQTILADLSDAPEIQLIHQIAHEAIKHPDQLVFN